MLPTGCLGMVCQGWLRGRSEPTEFISVAEAWRKLLFIGVGAERSPSLMSMHQTATEGTEYHCEAVGRIGSQPRAEPQALIGLAGAQDAVTPWEDAASLRL